jgi:hypothetical protein
MIENEEKTSKAKLYAQRLIDLGARDYDEFDELSNNTPLEELAVELVETLEERLEKYEKTNCNLTLENADLKVKLHKAEHKALELFFS